MPYSAMENKNNDVSTRGKRVWFSDSQYTGTKSFLVFFAKNVFRMRISYHSCY